MFYVEAISQRKRAEWDAIFGLTKLPVKSQHPTFTSSGNLCYILDPQALEKINPRLLGRLVGWLVMRKSMAMSEAQEIASQGLPIAADGDVKLITVNEDEQVESKIHPARPSFWSNWLHPAIPATTG